MNNRTKIQEWIKREIKPNLIKTINKRHTSYKCQAKNGSFQP
ncbi:hypothetical protein CLOBY_04700 [Clostridium saccharobutylicum]|nr:hypothetical protein CLOBY_04700 [Clostridium saccharobutylicum]NSB88257.1 hypothetical protein [Clostridium saccharobutylicum]NYC29288.1 hypothetical protein [Clostridium saccharobutylicum]OOM17874.1 hypothetical protein CLSAB_12880 [Clostridium saccharobutylicum]